jgi:hypothetical protein
MTRLTGWHRGGPWPGWLRWWYDQGGPARDARIVRAYIDQMVLGNLRPGGVVARQMGVSRSTVHRAIIRYRQRTELNWPPQVSNGFGLSQEQRRALRMRQLGYEMPQPRLTRSESHYVPPADQFDDNGDPAW